MKVMISGTLSSRRPLERRENYILAELDGVLIGSKIVAFCMILYLAWCSIEIDDKVLYWIVQKILRSCTEIIESSEP